MDREPAGGWCPGHSASVERRLSPPDVDRTVAPDITWYGHSDIGERETRAAWCEAVGPPVVMVAPHPTLASYSADTLVLVTWNVLAGGADLGAFVEAELGLECHGGVPVPQPHFRPFVLLLQEAYRSSSEIPRVPPDAPTQWRVGPNPRPADALDVAAFARSCGLSLVYLPSSRNGTGPEEGVPEDFGNAVAATLPLQDVVAIEVPFEAGRKVAVGAEVLLPGEAGTLPVVSVHLNVAATLVRTLVTGNRTRERQVLGLLEALTIHGWGDGAVVVGGDFNTWSSRDAALDVLGAALPDSPPRTTDGTRGPFPADHLFFRGESTPAIGLVPSSYEVVPSLYGSDHHARRFRISLAPRVVPAGSADQALPTIR